ncbi:hypothetical protein EXT47_05270 [Pseudoalteromonas sp. CO342X]|uniref:hypothetical protein n=1 Tax=Pseudoalteromonas sp. CO342X TaxID=1777270 RepID=UPI0010233942|nr:hypothetical protein [Pseudoalteromonas sp. CO342X]RZG16739.1 hypothetical protein EXT47_05270 [Pseudoalteromonas sp. CO342X]
MEIAPNFTAAQWRDLDLRSSEEDWQRAVDVLRDRLYLRYIEPVDALIGAEEKQEASNRKFGFTILAIDMLLMETLQAFKEGLLTTDGKSKAVFKRFLEQSQYFNSYFKTDDEREAFYKSFRCGILHQAEIQSSALVWSIGELYERADDMEVINRNAVHENLKKDLDDYLVALRSPENKELRKKFKNKMGSVANREVKA